MEEDLQDINRALLPDATVLEVRVMAVLDPFVLIPDAPGPSSASTARAGGGGRRGRACARL